MKKPNIILWLLECFSGVKGEQFHMKQGKFSI